MDEMQLQIEEYHQKAVESTGKVDVAAVKVTTYHQKSESCRLSCFLRVLRKVEVVMRIWKK